MQERVGELCGKRDLAFKLVSEIPHVACPKPDGAFYILPDVSAYFNTVTPGGNAVRDSHELCLELLRTEQVALVSGDAFGAPLCIRLSYAASTELIEESIKRLRRFLLSLKKA
jgi:aspartate/methionine/tyrosine aminotransferase